MSADSIPAGYMQIPRAAWTSLPKDSKVVIRKHDPSNANDTNTSPVYVRSVQDTPAGLILAVDVRPTPTRGKLTKAANIPAESIAELWKHIPAACQLEVMMLLDVIGVQTDELELLRMTVEKSSAELSGANSRIGLAESNLLAARRGLATLNDASIETRNELKETRKELADVRKELADVRKDLNETRRQMESLARLVKTLLPSADQPTIPPTTTTVNASSVSQAPVPTTDRQLPDRSREFGEQFPQRTIQRRQQGRASTTDRMFIPDSPM